MTEIKYCNCCGKRLSKSELNDDIHMDFATNAGDGARYHFQFCRQCFDMLVMGCALSPRE